MIPRFRPTLFFSDLKVLFDKRPSVEDLEKAFAKYVGWRYAVLFPYGHAAVYSFFITSGIKEKEIILPAYNCRVMVSAIIASNNYPVFIDCEDGSVNMDGSMAVSRIDQKTGAIIPTAMYGYPFDVDLYRSVSDRVLVLADLAHGLFEDHDGSIDRYKGIHAAIYSLGIGKQVSMLGGGVLCTNDIDIYHRVKDFRDKNFKQRNKRLFNNLFNFLVYSVFFSPLFYRLVYLMSEKTRLLDSIIGYDIGVVKILPDDFYDMPTWFQIGLGLRQMGRIQSLKERQRAIINRYDNALRGRKLKRIELLPVNPASSHYPVFTDYRDELSSYLASKGIHAYNNLKDPIYELPMARDFKDKGGYPHAERIMRRCVLLPLYDLMSEAEQNYIIDSLLAWDNS